MNEIYDVAVIGAGVYGSMIAVHLSKAGKNVCLIDKSVYGNEKASSHGMTRAGHTLYDLPEYHDLAVKSLGMYRSNFKNVIADTKAVLFAMQDLGSTHAQKVIDADFSNHVSLNQNNVREQFPRFDADCACVDQLGGIIKMRDVSKHLYEKLVHSPVKKQFEAEIKNIKCVNSGYSVEFQDNQRVLAEKILVCAGYQSQDVMSLFSTIEMPNLGIRKIKPGGLIHLKPKTDQQYENALAGHMPLFAYIEKGMFGVPIVKGYSDIVKIASFYDPTSKTYLGDEPFDFIKNHVPFLKDFEIVEPDIKDQCEYDYTEDGNFIVGQFDKLPNLFVACGWNGSGYKFAPVISEMMSGLIVTGENKFPEIFNPNRLK